MALRSSSIGGWCRRSLLLLGGGGRAGAVGAVGAVAAGSGSAGRGAVVFGSEPVGGGWLLELQDIGGILHVDYAKAVENA